MIAIRDFVDNPVSLSFMALAAIGRFRGYPAPCEHGYRNRLGQLHLGLLRDVVAMRYLPTACARSIRHERKQ